MTVTGSPTNVENGADRLEIDESVVRIWHNGVCTAVASVFPEGHAEAGAFLLRLSGVAASEDAGQALVHAALELARSSRASEVHVVGPLGASELLSAARAELNGCEVHAAGSTWILTATLP